MAGAATIVGLTAFGLVRAAPGGLAPGSAAVTVLVALALLALAALAAIDLTPAVSSYRDRRRIHDWLATVEDATSGRGVLEWIGAVVGDPELGVMTPTGVPPPDRVVTAVRRDGRLVTRLVHRREASDRLRSVLSPTVVALLESDRLLAQSRVQLDELRDVRRRTVQATDAGRRQRQRDLHDGAQQFLLALGMKLSSLADDAATSDDEPGRRRFDRAAAEASAALQRLRAIAHADAPPLLHDAGLSEAISALLEVTEAPVELRAVGSRRHDSAVEHAAYDLVRMVIETAAAGGRPVVVSVAPTSSTIVEVAAPTSVTLALDAIVDRVEAAGATFVVAVESDVAIYRVRES